MEINNDKLLTIGECAKLLNVSKETLRNWDKLGKLKPQVTFGKHRRYKITDIESLMNIEVLPKYNQEIDVIDNVIIYARVSSNEQKQKGDLDRQAQRLCEFGIKSKYVIFDIIKDVGSGLNDNRKGFNKLTDLVINKKITKIIIEHKDRLTRFQFNFIEKMLNSYGCEIIVMNNKEVSSDEELASDMMSLLASFSGKFYGRRSAERRKKNTND